MVEIPEHPQVLAARQVFVDRRVLAREANRSAHRIGLGAYIESSHGCRALGGFEKCGQNAHDCGFARTIRAQKGDDLTDFNGEIHPVKGAHIPEGFH